jgi:hypothetical protein
MVEGWWIAGRSLSTGGFAGRGVKRLMPLPVLALSHAPDRGAPICSLRGSVPRAVWPRVSFRAAPFMRVRGRQGGDQGVMAACRRCSREVASSRRGCGTAPSTVGDGTADERLPGSAVHSFAWTARVGERLGLSPQRVSAFTLAPTNHLFGVLPVGRSMASLGRRRAALKQYAISRNSPNRPRTQRTNRGKRAPRRSSRAPPPAVDSLAGCNAAHNRSRCVRSILSNRGFSVGCPPTLERIPQNDGPWPTPRERSRARMRESGERRWS